MEGEKVRAEGERGSDCGWSVISGVGRGEERWSVIENRDGE